MFSALYSKGKETINIHSLLHLADDVRNLGPLWTHSCFLFESYNGNLLKLFHRTQNVELQIVSAVAIMQSLPTISAWLWPHRFATLLGTWKLHSRVRCFIVI